MTQVSRLANPLVNEISSDYPTKTASTAATRFNDAQFLKYVTNPTLPVLLNTCLASAAVAPGTPRNDLVAAFLTGVKGLNQPLTVHPAELMRLNTSTHRRRRPRRTIWACWAAMLPDSRTGDGRTMT